MKTRNNENLLKKLEYPLLVAQRKVEEIEAKIDKIKRDILDPPIVCCQQVFKSHQDLRNHTKTKACKNKAQPMVKCTMCRNKFYGLTKGEVETLGIGNGRFDNSTYGKHYRKCFSCNECGYMFKSYKDKQQHLYSMPCRKEINITTDESESENEESENEIVMEINDRESCSSASSSEYTEWEFKGYSYGVDSKNDVYDENGTYIGIRYKDGTGQYILEYG